MFDDASGLTATRGASLLSRKEVGFLAVNTSRVSDVIISVRGELIDPLLQTRPVAPTAAPTNGGA